MKNKACLVLGGNGFIGKNLVKRLASLGASVTSLDLSDPTEKIKSITYFVADINQKMPALKFDYVFNLSGSIDHSSFAQRGRQAINTHYLGLLNIIEALDMEQLKGFVQIGSSDEYGNNPSPQVESMRESPLSSYSAAKVSASHLVQMLAKYEGFPGTVLRFFLVYGPGQNKQRFLPQVIQGCLEDKLFPTSRGEQLRDFCYIDDIVDAIIMAASNKKAHGEIFNIASGRPMPVASMIKKVKEMIGAGAPQYGQIPYRLGENMSLYANTSKARDLLGWRPKVDLEQGLSETISYYKQKGEIQV